MVDDKLHFKDCNSQWTNTNVQLMFMLTVWTFKKWLGIDARRILIARPWTNLFPEMRKIVHPDWQSGWIKSANADTGEFLNELLPTMLWDYAMRTNSQLDWQSEWIKPANMRHTGAFVYELQPGWILHMDLMANCFFRKATERERNARWKQNFKKTGKPALVPRSNGSQILRMYKTLQSITMQ